MRALWHTMLLICPLELDGDARAAGAILSYAGEGAAACTGEFVRIFG